MNSKKIILSIFVIFAIILITNNVFAAGFLESVGNVVTGVADYAIDTVNNIGEYTYNNLKAPVEYVSNGFKNNVNLVTNVVTDPSHIGNHLVEYGGATIKNNVDLVVSPYKNIYNLGKNQVNDTTDLLYGPSIKISDLELPAASSIVIKQDGSCTDPNYPYHLSIQGGTQGISGTILYFGFVGPNTFAANKSEILNFVYDKAYTTNSGIRVTDITDNIIKIDADKFTWTRNGTYSKVNFQNALFCLSKNFSGKKVNVLTWQYKDGTTTDYGTAAGGGTTKRVITKDEFITNNYYKDKTNYEFDMVENISVQALTGGGSTGGGSTGGGGTGVGSGSGETGVVDCSKTPGSKASPNWPSGTGFKGYTKGQICYKCNADQTKATRYNSNGEMVGEVEGLDLTTGSGLSVKNEGICDVSSGTGQDNAVASQPINLDFSVFSSISDISYSTNTTTQYKARKVDTPESYLIDYKNINKTISVNLASFSTGPVYVILAKPDQKDKIYGYLANIKSTGEFQKYTPQTAFTIDPTNLITNPAAMQYTLGADKTFKFNISGNAVDKLVLIFMQKSAGGLMVNLAYTNLYNLDYSEQSTYQLCEINRKIVSFYCNGYNCKLPVSCIDRWDFDPTILETTTGIEVGTTQTGQVTPPAQTPTGETPTGENPSVQTTGYTSKGKCSILIQKTVEEYIECLRRNIEIVNLNQKYALVIKNKQQGSSILGNSIIDAKYNTNQLCFTSKPFNDIIFSVAKKANLTEEETAQLWSRMAAESGCDVSTTCGDACGSSGLAQIMLSAWGGEAEYTKIKSYLLLIDSIKYDTYTKYKTQLNNVPTNPETAVEISIAINKYHKSKILSVSKDASRPLLDNMDKEYDIDDAIDMEFATAYAYSGSARISHFSSGIVLGTFNVNRHQGIVYVALHKVGYYLSYKRMIYQCNKEVMNNAFVTSYKTIYGGQYCK